MSFIWAAIALGFASSFHCIGMCGPIAMALPIGKASAFKRFYSVFLYNAGRILTYASLGALFGVLGSGICLGSFQSNLSIVIGISLLLSVFLTNKQLQNYLQTKSFWFFNALKNKLSQLFVQHNLQSIFFIGLLNGLLPCGMVYLAIAGALVSGSFINSILFMTFFGVGTLTVMLTLPLFSHLIHQTFKNKIQKLSPAIKITMATLLILRGLNLGIPYLSPQISQQNNVVCHAVSKNNHPIILCSKPINAIKK